MKLVYCVTDGINLNPFIEKYPTLVRDLRFESLGVIRTYLKNKENKEIVIFLPISKSVFFYCSFNDMEYRFITPEPYNLDYEPFTAWTVDQWEEQSEILESGDPLEHYMINKNTDIEKLIGDEYFEMTLEKSITAVAINRYAGSFLEVIGEISKEIGGQYTLPNQHKSSFIESTINIDTIENDCSNVIQVYHGHNTKNPIDISNIFIKATLT